MNRRYVSLISIIAILFIFNFTTFVIASENDPGGSGSQDEKSADEIARELSNPNNSFASLNFKNQLVTYKGDIPGADDQSNYQLIFQPVFPFSMGKTPGGGTANLFIRPAIPLIIDAPAYDAGTNTFDGVSGLGDIVFDIAYGGTEESGFLWALGGIGTLPTGTEPEFTKDKFSIGPECLTAKFEDWGVYGMMLNHQWDVAGSGKQSVNLSGGQLFLVLFGGGGVTYGSRPIWAYDWNAKQATIPLDLFVSKTYKIGNTPLKLAFAVDYYVEKADAFGPDWMFSLEITPVVKNFIEDWIKGG